MVQYNLATKQQLYSTGNTTPVLWWPKWEGNSKRREHMLTHGWFTLVSWLVSLVTQSCPTLCNPTDCSTPGFPVYHQLPKLAQSRPWSWWCHPTISSSVILFFSHLQSFPSSGVFQLSQLFPSGGQSIGVSASTSVLPMNSQDWSPLGLTGWVSLQSKRLSRVFANIEVQTHQFFGAQLSL